MLPAPPPPAAEVHDLVLDDAWAYGPGILHGGFLLQSLGELAVSSGPHRDPFAVSAHFLSATRAEPAQVEVQRLRTGRSVTTNRATLSQAGRMCVDAVVTAGRLPQPGTPFYLDAAPPVLPPLEQCEPNTGLAGDPRNGITEQLDIRLDPAAGGWLGPASHRAEVRGWIRHADGSDADPMSLLCIADALPPVTYALALRSWVPTISFTVHVRARPAPGWLRVLHRAAMLADGILDESCEVWDSTDRLVAQSTQLAMYRQPPARIAEGSR